MRALLPLDADDPRPSVTMASRIARPGVEWVMKVTGPGVPDATPFGRARCTMLSGEMPTSAIRIAIAA